MPANNAVSSSLSITESKSYSALLKCNAKMKVSTAYRNDESYSAAEEDGIIFRALIVGGDDNFDDYDNVGAKELLQFKG